MSGGVSIGITLSGEEALVARFKGANSRVVGKIRDDLIDLALDSRSEASTRAGSRTGRLASSIQGTVVTTPTSVSMVLFTQGVPYAQAQESGANVKGHIIRATRGAALAFMWGSFGHKVSLGAAFYAKVNWPGARIPAKHYIRDTLRSKRAEFESIVRNAAATSLGSR